MVLKRNDFRSVFELSSEKADSDIGLCGVSEEQLSFGF